MWMYLSDSDEGQRAPTSPLGLLLPLYLPLSFLCNPAAPLALPSLERLLPYCPLSIPICPPSSQGLSWTCWPLAQLRCPGAQTARGAQETSCSAQWKEKLSVGLAFWRTSTRRGDGRRWTGGVTAGSLR